MHLLLHTPSVECNKDVFLSTTMFDIWMTETRPLYIFPMVQTVLPYSMGKRGIFLHSFSMQSPSGFITEFQESILIVEAPKTTMEL